jgi:hypothetical protein
VLATVAHPIFAAMLNADPRPRRPGLLVCRHTQPFPMNLVGGLRVTTAAETILAAARDLGVLDLVILGDSALRLRHCTLTDLKITARQRRRGAPLLRQVIPLLDERSGSAWESIMRVCTRQPRFWSPRSRRSSTTKDGSSLVPTYRSTGRSGSTSTTARGIAKLMSTKSIWNATATSSARVGSGTASPQHTCGETAPQSSPTPTGCSDGPGIHVGWLRGRACSATRSLGRAGRARAYRNWRRALAETGQMQQGDGRNLGGT